MHMRWREGWGMQSHCSSHVLPWRLHETRPHWLATDTAATDHLQQWHVEGITFRKDEYVKVMRISFSHCYCPYPSNIKSDRDHAQAQQLMSAVCAVLPSSGLTCFWDTAGQSSVLMPMTVGDTQNCIADVQSLVVYSATNPSLPLSVAQICAIDVDGEDFRQIICKQEEVQLITAKLNRLPGIRVPVCCGQVYTTDISPALPF